mmetsp:Transcript_35324/g.85494  ORF Transcript_35324/g.85494 Transcript_35324/m.85494 type:complete len:298 (+) Transcript_35324:214-1107(+)
MLKIAVIMKTTFKHHHHHHRRRRHQLSLLNSVLVAACCCYCYRFVMVLACCCCCCCIPLLLYDNSRVLGFTVVRQSSHHHSPMRLLTANFIRTPTKATSGDDNNDNHNLTRNNYRCVRSTRPTSKLWQQFGKKKNNNDEGEKFETLQQVDDEETTTETTTATTAAAPDFDSLIDMDVVVYSFVDDPLKEKRFAALQEDGILSPLSVWTTEPAFGNSIEFLVDEEERFMLAEEMTESRRIELHYLIDESSLSYGSRQCQRGVSNPHGEENELLYYIDKDIVERFDAKVDVKPELEILW